ncbi:hypothetical protein BGW39_001807 [Mortierella sp. 14UC]|nr:hypothetical protein BGW39_001807 [Mortierella sp. 14UC]
MKFTIAFAALATVAVSSVSAQYTNLVNAAAGPIQYAGSNYTINPSPMCIGREFCLTATGILSAPLMEGARLAIIGKYLGRHFYTDNGDLCSLLAASGTPCPIPAGAFNLKLCRLIKPNLPPNWPVEYQFEATNRDYSLIFAQKTPGYPGLNTTPSNPRLDAVICP